MANKERYLQIILLLNLLLQFCSSTNVNDKYTLESIHLVSIFVSFHEIVKLVHLVSIQIRLNNF